MDQINVSIDDIELRESRKQDSCSGRLDSVP